MLSILVGHSFFKRFDRKQVERAKPYPPLATLQVAALLRQAGHDVAVFDAMLAEGTQDFDAQLARTQPQVVLFYEDNFNFLTKMCLGKMRQACMTMMASARHAGARVIVAGSDASDAPLDYLQAGAELVLRGEGLADLPRLIARLDQDRAQAAHRLLEGLPDTLALVNGLPVPGSAAPACAAPAATTAIAASTTSAPPAAPTPTTARIAWPAARSATPPEAPLETATAWDLVDLSRYRSTWRNAHGYFSLNMAASKGCSFKCAWCAKPIWGSRYQQRSPEAVAAELIHLKQRFGPDHIWFADDIFGFRADWVNRFADLLEAHGGGLPFTIQTRADLISEAMARALARAGCREVWIGAESGSQRVLDAMNKGTTVDEILRARRLLGEQGVRVGFFIQLGYLGEGLEDLQATRRLIEQAQPDEIGVSVSYPLPGTLFHEQVRAQLGDKTHWDDSADLAMMFQGSFGTAFYRQVRDLLHEWVDRRPAPDASAAAAAGSLAARPWHERWDDLMASAQPAPLAEPFSS